jgi:hypothetical protein
MKLSQRKLTFLVFSALCVASFAFFVVAQENSDNDKNIFLDSDQDGLSDTEEITYGTDPKNNDTDGDGYTDGNEIKSGYDPLKHSPGDKIVVKKEQSTVSAPKEENGEENLTQDLSVEVATLINDRSGENKEVSMEDIDAIIQKITSEKVTFEDLPAVDEKEVKIKKQNYSKLSDDKRKEKEREDALEYLTAVSYILANNSPEKISDTSDLEKISNEIISQVSIISPSFSNFSYFENLSDKGSSILEDLKDIEVPEKFLELHLKGLKLAKYAVSLKDEIKPDENDPISSIMGFSKVQNLITLASAYSNEIMDNLSKLDITEIPLDL